MKDREDPIGQKLIREKKSRNDLPEYIAQNLVRQKIINNHVIGFAKFEIKPKGTIIDACAGPEGAVFAAQTLGFDCVSNDISYEFARNLGKFGAPNVIVSEFPNTPYKTSCADAILFVFALNNIVNTKSTFKEANRLLTDNGVIVTADPGPTRWVTNILLHSVLTKELLNNPQAQKMLDKQPFKNFIPDYFKNKKGKYSIHEYSNFFLEGCLDISRGELSGLAETSLSQTKRLHSVPFGFQGLVTQNYHTAMEKDASELGYEAVKKGLIVAGKENNGHWVITTPQQLSENDWIGEVEEARMLRGRIGEALPESIKVSETRLYIPILVMKK